MAAGAVGLHSTLFFDHRQMAVEHQQVVGGGVRVALSIAGQHFDVVVGEDFAPHGLVDHALYFRHVPASQFWHAVGLLAHGVEAEQIESQTVGHDVFARHHAALLLGVAIAQVDRMVGSKIFVERDAKDAVVDDDALVERSYLGVDAWHNDAG